MEKAKQSFKMMYADTMPILEKYPNEPCSYSISGTKNHELQISAAKQFSECLIFHNLI